MKNQVARINQPFTAATVLENVFSFLTVEWNRLISVRAESTEEQPGFHRNNKQHENAKNNNSTILQAYGSTILSKVRIAILDQEFRFAWVNKKFCKLLQVKVGDLIGKRVDEIRPMCNGSGGFVHIFDILRKGEKWSGEMRAGGESSEAFWIRVHIIPVKDAKGHINSFVVFNSDITEAKMALEKSFVSEARYKAMVENQPDLVAVCNLRGDFIYANASFCQFTGRTCDELGGISLRDFFLPVVPDDYLERIFSLTPSNPEVSGIFQFPDRKGDKAWMSVRAKGLFNDHGALYEILLICRDVSELKNAELQKQSYIQDLERIAFMTSHKVRGPISTMLGLIELLRLTEASATEWQEHLADFKHAIYKLDVYTKDLSNFIYGRQASE